MIAPIKRHSRWYKCDWPDREWLWHHYMELDKSGAELEEEFGIPRYRFYGWFSHYGIKKPRRLLLERHSRRMSGAGNPAWVGGTTAKYWKKVALKRFSECQWCGSKDRLELHHIDHNPKNNDPSNHAILCKPCNRVEAYMWRLQNDGRAEITFYPTEHKMTIQFTRRI